MATGSQSDVASDQGRSSLLAANPPGGKGSNKWTKHDWNAYLVKMRVEVDAGEAPVELYLRGLEILSEQKSTYWFCFQQDLPADQAQAPVDQGGTPACPPTRKAIKSEIAHSYTAIWIAKDWEWLFQASQDIKDHAAWLHHVAG